jgi:hypothetical protein
MAQNPSTGPAPTEACSCDEQHRGIPRDADGNPFFLVLPDGDRVRYERWTARCEKAWTQTGDPRVLDEAQTLAWAYRQPNPTWLRDALSTALANSRAPEHAERHRDAQMHFRRYRDVMDMMFNMVRGADGTFMRTPRFINTKGRPISLQKAFEAVADERKEDWRMVSRSYYLVMANLENGHGGLYHVMKPRTRRALTK